MTKLKRPFDEDESENGHKMFRFRFLIAYFEKKSQKGEIKWVEV